MTALSRCIIAVWLCYAGLTVAQQPYFRPVELPSGFEGGQIELAVQAGGGFLWLGTDRGLYRFDGTGFTHIPHAADSLDNHLTAMAPGSGDTLWLGFRSGLIAYLTPESAHVQVLETEEGHPGQKITDIAADSRGNLWFSTYGEGLYVYNGRRMYNIAMDDGLSDNYVYCLETDVSGRVWAGTDKGINICRFANGNKEIKTLGTRQGLPDNIVTALQRADDSFMVAGMYQEGLCRIETRTLSISRVIPGKAWEHGTVRDVVTQGKTWWIATSQNELLQLVWGNEPFIRAYGADNGLPEGGFRNLHVDDENNLWIVPAVSGLVRVNPVFEMISKHEGLDFTGIHALLADRRGNIWFFNKNGLMRHNVEFSGHNTIRKYALPLGERMQVISLFEDSLGYIWAGTFGAGVFRIDPETGDYRQITVDDGLVDNNVLGISGSGDQIWFATLGGVSRLNAKEVGRSGPLSFNTISGESGLGNNYVYAVHTDSQGDTWFATDGNGMVRLRDGQFEGFSERSGHLASAVVYSITEDHRGHLWFSTLKAGVYRYDGKDFINFNLDNGLRDLQVTSVLHDGKGNIFLAHRKGIDILDADSLRFSYYGEAYGLGNINPDLNTASTDAGGNIWLGTDKGLIRYTPPDPAVRRVPKTYLFEPSVFFEKVDFGKRHRLPYRQNYLSFRFAGLWLQNPEAVTYQYQLKGYDPDWVTTRDNTVIYPNLPPGKYRFTVRASAIGVFDGPGGESFDFTIRAPFWKTWYFLSLLFLILAGLLFGWMRWREQALKSRERQEREKVLLEFENLKSQVNPHFLFNSFNSLIGAIEEDPERAVTYVEKLAQFFRNILTYRNEELIPLGRELEIARDYFFIHRQRYGDLVSLDCEVPEAVMDWLIPPLTLQILVENAIKHNVVSVASPLTISIRFDNGQLVVSNRISPKRNGEDSTGTGLENVRNRFRLLAGEPVEVIQENGLFIVKVPLIKPTL